MTLLQDGLFFAGPIGLIGRIGPIQEGGTGAVPL